MKFSLAALATASLALSGAAFAQDEDRTLILGAGAGILFEPYADLDDDASVFPVPLVAYEKGRIGIAGKTIAVSLAETGGASVSAIADYRFQGYEDDDSPVLDGMDDRNGTLELGGRVGAQVGPFNVSGQALFDVLGEHEGYELLGTIGWTYARGLATQVTPYVGVLHESEDLAGYYYGVEADEAAVLVGGRARPAYQPGESTSAVIGINARQALSEKWVVFLNGRYQFLSDEIKDSPIVDEDGRGQIALALGYVF